MSNNNYTKKYNYTYKITHLKALPNSPKYYIGLRSSTVLPIEDIDYMSSSKTLTALIKESDSSDFSKEILEVFDTREEALENEIYYHNLYDVCKNPEYFNLAKQTSVGFDRSGSTLSDEHIELLRKNSKGEKNNFYGKTHTEATRKKISEKNKGKRLGYKLPEETKKKMSKSRRDHFYEITFPDGITKVTTYNLYKFPKEYPEYNLLYCKLYAVARGERNHHKNFKVRMLSEDGLGNTFSTEVLPNRKVSDSTKLKLKKIASRNSYLMIHPDRSYEIINHLGDFAKSKGFFNGFGCQLSGDRNHVHGYVAVKLPKNYTDQDIQDAFDNAFVYIPPAIRYFLVIDANGTSKILNTLSEIHREFNIAIATVNNYIENSFKKSNKNKLRIKFLGENLSNLEVSQALEKDYGVYNIS